MNNSKKLLVLCGMAFTIGSVQVAQAQSQPIDSNYQNSKNVDAKCSSASCSAELRDQKEDGRHVN